MKKKLIIPVLVIAFGLHSCKDDDSDKKVGSIPTQFKTEVVPVTNPITGRTWMDRNMGAKRVAQSPTDTEAYGDFYQWGRKKDGHQKRSSEITDVASDNPNHNKFIKQPVGATADWRETTDDALWVGANAINNPCPDGYRIPTEEEMNEERLSWNSNDAFGAFNSPLKWSMAGVRGYTTGDIFDEGQRGDYWASDVPNADMPRFLHFTNGSSRMRSGDKATGYSVRCIQD